MGKGKGRPQGKGDPLVAFLIVLAGGSVRPFRIPAGRWVIVSTVIAQYPTALEYLLDFAPENHAFILASRKRGKNDADGLEGS
jgi:hypothetical protein